MDERRVMSDQRTALHKPKSPNSFSGHCSLITGHRYSYLSVSAGKILDADHDGYSVATNETPTATSATKAPSIHRGANGT